MSLKTLESSAFFGGKLLISIWKYGIKKLPVGKNVEEEEQELDLLLHQPQAIYSAQNISGTLLLKLPSLRATVPSSTSAIGIPFHPFACAEGILFCKLVCPKFNQWFLNVSVGAGYSPACANASARDSADTSSQFCISTRSDEKVHGPPSAVVQLFTLATTGSHKSLLLLWGVKTNLGLENCFNH